MLGLDCFHVVFTRLPFPAMASVAPAEFGGNRIRLHVSSTPRKDKGSDDIHCIWTQNITSHVQVSSFKLIYIRSFWNLGPHASSTWAFILLKYARVSACWQECLSERQCLALRVTVSWYKHKASHQLQLLSIYLSWQWQQYSHPPA